MPVRPLFPGFALIPLHCVPSTIVCVCVCHTPASVYVHLLYTYTHLCPFTLFRTWPPIVVANVLPLLFHNPTFILYNMYGRGKNEWMPLFFETRDGIVATAGRKVPMGNPASPKWHVCVVYMCTLFMRKHAISRNNYTPEFELLDNSQGII